MDKLITVHDVKERYGCSNPTARKYIRQCNPHMENPLTTTEQAFREWEFKRTVFTPKKMSVQDYEMYRQAMKGLRTIVPRRR